MARRARQVITRYRTRAAPRVRRAARGALGGVQGKLMKIGWGAAGGVAAKFGATINPTFGPAAGLAAVGYLGNNDTLLTLAGMQLANLVPFGSSSTSGSSGGAW